MGCIVKYISDKFLKGHSLSAVKHIKQEILIKETESSETLNYTIVDTQFHRILIDVLHLLSIGGAFNIT